RLAAEAKNFAQQGKLAETVAAWNKKLAIEREIYGNVHAVVADSLVVLAQIHEVGNDFQAGAKARQEALVILTKLYGTKDWRVTKTKLVLEDMKLRSRLS